MNCENKVNEGSNLLKKNKIEEYFFNEFYIDKNI